jgi:hypothetical protein
MRMARVFFGYSHLCPPRFIEETRLSQRQVLSGSSLWTDHNGSMAPHDEGARMTFSHAHLDRTTAELLCNLGSVRTVSKKPQIPLGAYHLQLFSSRLSGISHLLHTTAIGRTLL